MKDEKKGEAEPVESERTEPSISTSTAEPSPAPPATKKKTKKTTKKKTKKGPGRPKKKRPATATTDAPPDQAADRPPGYRKDPEELLDPRRGIQRRLEDLRRALDAARQREPHVNWVELPDQATGPPIGAEIPETTWRPLIAAPVRLTEGFVTGQTKLVDIMGRVPDKAINDAAKNWSLYSRHLGLSDKGAALAGAVVGSLATLGAALGRAGLYLLFRERFEDDDDPRGDGRKDDR